MFGVVSGFDDEALLIVALYSDFADPVSTFSVERDAATSYMNEHELLTGST